MKQIKLFVTVVILVLLIGLIAITSYTILDKETEQSAKKFYVGVTYGGNSIQEAKELIDKVKNYTNLFILQSGHLSMFGSTAIIEIGDYAIASNLNYAIYCGINSRAITNEYLIEAKERWGEQFIGIYYNDEPGGEMLDGHVALETVYTHRK